MASRYIESLPFVDRLETIPLQGGEIPFELNKLIQFAHDVVLRDHPDEDIRMGHWVPLYGDKPEVTMPLLYHMFQDLVKRPGYQDRVRPRLLECGSGYGMVGRVAALAGFEVFNVEIQKDIHDEAKKYDHLLKLRGMIDESAPHTIFGNYYTPEWFEYAAAHFLQHYNLLGDVVDPRNLAMVSYNLGVSKFTQEAIISALKVLREGTGALAEHSLVTSDGGLDVDVVHIYPSDPMFPHGFLQQMGSILRSGSMLVTYEKNSQIIKAIEEERFFQCGFTPTTWYMSGKELGYDFLGFQR